MAINMVKSKAAGETTGTIGTVGTRSGTSMRFRLEAGKCSTTGKSQCGENTTGR